LIQLTHLQIDESTLTGESAPVDKTVEPIENESIPNEKVLGKIAKNMIIIIVFE
jgi:magnesium-transporting ATPase (P-type)